MHICMYGYIDIYLLERGYEYDNYMKYIKLSTIAAILLPHPRKKGFDSTTFALVLS